jgi:hypothetical protein
VSARDREPAPAADGGAAELPPAASLLSVPIFRAAAQRAAAPAPTGRTPAGQQGAAQPSPRTEDAPPAAGPAAPAQPDPPANGRSPGPGTAPYAVVPGSGEASTSRLPPQAEAARTAPALKAVAGAQSYRTLLDYWRTLARQGRAPVDRLDAGLIAARWPYAMLLRVPRGGVVDIVHVYAPEPAGGGGAGTQSPFASDQASQISSWVLEIAQEAAGSRQPSRHSETFQQAGRARRLTAELLPCHADGDPADHLLLQLRDG